MVSEYVGLLHAFCLKLDLAERLRSLLQSVPLDTMSCTQRLCAYSIVGSCWKDMSARYIGPAIPEFQLAQSADLPVSAVGVARGRATSPEAKQFATIRETAQRSYGAGVCVCLFRLTTETP